MRRWCWGAAVHNDGGDAPPNLEANRYTRRFWAACARGALEAALCRDCRHTFLPAGPVCPRCWSRSVRTRRLSGTGTVATFTVYRQAYHPAFKPPLVVALIQLDEGPRLVSNVVACPAESVQIGMRVRVRFEQQGDYTLPRFVPLATSATQRSVGLNHEDSRYDGK